MEHPYNGIFHSWYLRGIFNDIGKRLIYITQNGKTKNQNYTFNAISTGKEKPHCVHTETHVSLEIKIKMLTVAISDSYFMVARIFQTFKTMYGLPL